MKKLFKFLVAVFMGFALVSCTTTESLRGVTLDKEAITLVEGETATLEATISPENLANETTIIWSTTNDKVATVNDEGVVTAVKAGTAKIKVTATRGAVRRQDTCTVKVLPKAIPVTGITLDKNEGRLDVGESITLTPTISPSDATNKSVIWSSSNETVAVVNGGFVTALSVGNATITVTTVDQEKSAAFNLTVYQSVKGVSLDKASHTMEVGDTFILNETVNPEVATNKEVTWTSTNPHVASVNNGHVTAMGPGNAVIIVTTVEGNYKATCYVSVVRPVEGVTLDSTSLNLVVNEETTLVATILPSDATNKEVTWVSSNPSIVKVENGKVKALAPGNAIVSVITLDGHKEATCTITVTQPVTGVELNENLVELELGDTFELEAKVYPTNATNKGVKWTSSDPSVATVVDGVVYTHDFGNVTISVETLDGKYKDICVVLVTRYVDEVTLNHSSYSLNINSSVQLEASILPEDATNKNVTWTSSDETVAFVNNRGLVVGLRVGSATIIVTTKDGNHKATCLITVEKFENEITSENINVTYGESYEVEFDAIANVENAEIKYYKGLREISKPTDAGTYKVVITVPESATYKKASLEVSLVIAKRELIVEIDNQEVTYGDDEEAKTYELIAGEKAFNHKDEDVFEVVRSEGNDAGTYDIYVEIINDNYTVLFEKASYVINPKVVVKPTAITGLVYNNELLEGVKDNEGYSVEDGFAIEADTHIAYVSLDSKQNYVWEDGTTSDLEIEYVIALRQIKVVIDDQEVTYGDDEATLTYTLSGDLAKGHEDEDVFEIVRVSGDNVGEYEISLSQLNDNYNITSNTATYTINKYEIKGISFEDKVVEYDGEAHKLEIEGTLPEGVEVTYTPANEYTEKGVYDIEVSFVDTTGNYIVPSNMEAKLEIYVSVKGISLNETSLRLDPTDSYTLVATLNPINPTNDEVIWTSSNEDVVTVDQDGNLVALEVGNAVITVTTLEGNFKATCNVEVSILPESVEIQNTEEELLTTDVLALNAVVYPLDATNKNLIWTSSDTNIATVDSNGVVTPVEPGFVTITVKTVVGNYEDEITIEIIQLVEEITLNRVEASIVETYNLQLIATINPVDATNKSVVWSSSNELVATVSQDGLVEALSVGITTITVKALDGSNVEATCEITVTKLPVHAESVTVNRLDLGNVLVDEFALFEVVVEPANITDTITWTTSDDTIATVDQSGKVKALNAGTVKVQAIVGKDTPYQKIGEYELVISKHQTTIYGLNDLEITYGTTYNYEPFASSSLTVDVKYYEGSTLLDEKPVNAGIYKVVATVGSNYKYEATSKEATLTINKVKLEKPLANANNTFTYNKEAHTYTLLESAYYTISNNSATDAGRYEAVVSIKNTVNYEWADGTNTDLLYEFVINKAKVETPTANTGLVYNGLEQTGVNEDERYTIEDGKATIAGTHIAKVTLKDNYEWLDSSFDGYVMWTISKATYDMFNVAWVYEGPYTYNKAEQGVTLTGLPEGVTVKNYINASATNAGTYTARVELQYDSSNYYPVSVDPITWEIKKVKLDMQDVAWNYTNAFAYNGSKHTVALTDVPSEITVTYTDNEETNAGTYVAVATFAYDTNNYTVINNNVDSLRWEITPSTKEIEVNDLVVEKGRPFEITYFDTNKEVLPEYEAEDTTKVYYVNTITEPIQNKTGTWEGMHIDATNGKWAPNNSSWAQVNQGTIITFQVPLGAEVTVGEYNAGAYEVEIDGTTCTITAVANSYISTITVSTGTPAITSSAKIDAGEFTGAIQNTTGTWGPFSVDATAAGAKFVAHNGQYILVNPNTVFTFQTIPGSRVEMDVYSNIENFDITIDESGLVTVKVLNQDYIENIYVFCPQTLSAQDTVKYYNSLGEEVVSLNQNGEYKMVVTAGIGTNYIGSDEATITVFTKAASVTLDYSSASVALNGTLKLNATVNPDDTTDQRVVWSSNNEAVAKVDQEGNVTPVSEGEVTITVTTVDGGHTATCVVRVTPRFLPATDVELSQAENITTMKVGDTLALTATFTPADHTDNVKWTSSNPNVASVHNGVVTAHKATNEPIIITVEAGNVSDTYTITSINKVETTITDLNDVTATYGDDYVVAPETNSDGKMTITYVGVDNEYNSTTKPTDAGKYNIEVVVEETTKYTAKASVATLTINKKQVEKDIYLGDMIVEKGEAFDINYVEKENTIPTLTIIDKTINLLESTEPIQGKVVEWNGLTIDTTAQGSYWGNNGSGWIMINAGTVVTFEVPEGATVTATEYQYADIARFNVEGTTCTLTVDRQTYLSEIRVVGQLEIKETGKVLASNFTGHIEGNRGTWGPFMVDATANGAKFKAHNGQYIQVNAGTVIRVQTVPGTYVDVETYEDKDILDVTVEESGLATITVKENGYIEAINIMTPNKVLGEEGTVKFYNALDEEVTPNANGTYKMKITIGEDRNHIGVTAEATLTVITSVKGVSLNKEETTLAVDGTEKLIATITPEDVTNSELVWSSSNNNVVVVDQDGNITALQPGEAVVKVTTVDGGYTAECVVKVSKYANTITAGNINATYGTPYGVIFDATANKENAVITYYDGETKLDEKPTNAGIYRVVITVPATSTYKEVTKEVTLTIQKRSIEVNVNNQTITYGDEDKALTYTRDGELAYDHEDSDIFEIVRSEGNDAGTYSITLNVLNNNYVVTYNSATYTINEKAATVVWDNANNRTYTGAVFNNPTAHIVGVNGEELPLVVTMTTEGEFKNVGTYQFAVEDIANYSLSNTTKEVVVNKATLIVNWTKQETYTYGEEFDAPSASVTTLEGETIQLTPVIISGQVEFLDAGSYDFKVEYETTNYNITNSTLEDVLINKAKVNKPVGKDNLVYNKDTQTGIEFDDKLISIVEGSIEGTNAQDYTVIFELKDANNYEWADETIEDIEVSFTIGQLPVNEPTVSGTYTYNKAEQEVVLDGYDSSYMTIVSGNVGKDAATYTVVITLDSNHTWAEGSDGKVTWSIGKATLDLTDVAWDYNGNLVYNGKAQTVKLANVPDEITVTYAGNTQTNAGENYTASATFEYDTNNYELENNNVEPLAWKINKANATVIWVNVDDRPYTGNEFEAPTAHIIDVLGNELALEVTMTTDGEFKDAKTYEFNASEKDTNNYNLIDSTTSIEVAKVAYDTTKFGLVVPSSRVTYDGNEHIVYFTSLPDEVTATIVYHTDSSRKDEHLLDGNPIKVGKYFYRITYTVDGNHEPISKKDGNFYIDPITVNVTWVDADDLEIDYDGRNHALTASTNTQFVEGDDVRFVFNGDVTAKDAGEYTYEVSLEGADAGNYTIADEDLERTLVINKLEVKVNWIGSTSVIYNALNNALECEIESGVLPNETVTIEYVKGYANAVKIGTYKYEIKLSGAHAHNYYVKDVDLSRTLEIKEISSSPSKVENVKDIVSGEYALVLTYNNELYSIPNEFKFNSGRIPFGSLIKHTENDVKFDDKEVWTLEKEEDIYYIKKGDMYLSWSSQLQLSDSKLGWLIGEHETKGYYFYEGEKALLLNQNIYVGYYKISNLNQDNYANIQLYKLSYSSNQKVDVTISNNEGGNVEWSTATGELTDLYVGIDTVKLTLKPEEGKTVKSVIYNGVYQPISESDTDGWFECVVEPTVSGEITVEFGRILPNHLVTWPESENVTIKDSADNNLLDSYQEESTISFKVIPSSDYYVQKVEVKHGNNEPTVLTATNGLYSFEMETSDVEIIVTLGEKLTVTFDTDIPNSTIKVTVNNLEITSGAKVEPGTEVGYSISTEFKYVLDKVNGVDAENAMKKEGTIVISTDTHITYLVKDVPLYTIESVLETIGTSSDYVGPFKVTGKVITEPELRSATHNSYEFDVDDGTGTLKMYSANVPLDKTVELGSIVTVIGYGTCYKGTTPELAGDTAHDYPVVISVEEPKATVEFVAENATIKDPQGQNLVKREYKPGANVEFIATANQGYKISNVVIIIGDGEPSELSAGNVDYYVFSIGEKNAKVIVTAVESRTLTLDIDSNIDFEVRDSKGNPLSNGDEVCVEEEISYTITANTGWVLDKVNGKDANGVTSMTGSIVVGENATISASAKKATYSITGKVVDGLGNDALNIADIENLATSGEHDSTITFSVELTDNSYEIIGVRVNNSTSNYTYNDGIYSFTLTSETTVEVIVKEKEVTTYKVTYNNFNGKIEGLSESYIEGANVEFTVTPYADYYIDSVSVESVLLTPENGNNYKFTMPNEDVTINIEIKEKPVVTIEAGAHTIIKVKVNGQTLSSDSRVLPGTEIKFTIEAADEYYVTNVTLSNEKVELIVDNGTYSFEMPKEDISIIVETSLKTYTISSRIANKEGTTIGATGATITALESSAQSGTLITFGVEANSGYELVEVKTIVGETTTTLTGTNNEYTFTLSGNTEVVIVVKEKVAETRTYVFSNYTAGAQYAKDEKHVLDDYVTVTTTDAHFTSELRLYSSSTNNGYAIIKSNKMMTSLSFNAGNKVDTLNIYHSNDGGETWTLLQGVPITSTSYLDYSVDFGGNEYGLIKLDVAGTQQVRLKKMTISFSETDFIYRESNNITCEDIEVEEGNDYSVDFEANNIANSTITYYTSINGTKGQILQSKPTEVGEYIIVISIPETNEYYSAEKEVKLTIKEKQTAPTTKEITFSLGANGSASHNDGSGSSTYTETVDGYKLSITGGTNMYTGARDQKGNSCIKLGASKNAGSLTFKVPEDVNSVVIYVAKYKSNAAKVKINNQQYTLNTNSNDGQYDTITVDTSFTKTVTIETGVNGDKRCMINTIVFVAGA